MPGSERRHGRLRSRELLRRHDLPNIERGLSRELAGGLRVVGPPGRDRRAPRWIRRWLLLLMLRRALGRRVA